MKRLIVLMVMIPTVILAEAPATNSVGVTSVRILPPRPVKNAMDWEATTAYPQGAVVLSNVRLYMAVVGGTSGASGPTHASGDAADGTVVWREFTKARKRHGFAIVNDGASTVYVSAGYQAVVGAGVRLNASGGTWYMDDGDIQAAIYAISDAATNNVTVQEWVAER